MLVVGVSAESTSIVGSRSSGAVSSQTAPAEGSIESIDAATVRRARVALGLEGTRARVREASAELGLVIRLKEADDRTVARAESEIGELRGEARKIAENTVEGAVTNFQLTRIETNLLESENLNSAVRAEAMGDAALVADTEIFAEYRNKQKDLDIAEAIHRLRQERNQKLAAEVDQLQAGLDVDLARLTELEERNLQRMAADVSIDKSTWFQSLGRKQGFYLLTCPVGGPHSFIDSWGFPRSGGRRHRGVDIIADTGVPIVAPTHGRVEHFDNRVGGRSFRMWDEQGNYYYGTHMSAYGKQGEVVAGEVIGYVGDDGNAAGIPHLHFEIHAGRRGNQINPFIDSASVCEGARY